MSNNSSKTQEKLKSKEVALCQSQKRITPSVSYLAENILNTPLNRIGVNPFVNRTTFGRIDSIKVWVFGIIFGTIRIPPMLLFILLAAILAKISCFTLWAMKLMRLPSNWFKKASKFVVFGFIRLAFFVSGFYWVKMTDKSGESKTFKPNIIPIASHSTFFDVILLIKLGVPAIVSRFENSKMCLVGSILKMCEPVYVKRDEKSSRMKAADDIKERALVGRVMIFPEGTCTNRIALLQFKMGAFLPQLPVQPVVIKWNLGKYDTISWTHEGPGIVSILFHTLGQLSTDCEIIKLPAYTPSDEERADTRLFADNVAKVMCDELGVLQSFYSYDDVMFMGFADEIKIFRSPVCIKLLKVCYKLAKENSKHQNPSNSLSKKLKVPKLAFFNPKYFGLGEDFEQTSHIPDFYAPKVNERRLKKKKKLFTSDGSRVKRQNSDDVKCLPLSGAMRKPLDVKQIPTEIAVTSEVAQEKRFVYEKFCEIVSSSIDQIEEKGELRPIESTEDLAKLLNLKDSENSNSFIKSSALVELLKAIEFSTIDGPTTLHLLIALHLCDCREPNLWERIRASMILLSADRKNINYGNDKNKSTQSESESRVTSLNLMQFRQLLWYSLGLQEFNDRFFIQQDFDFEFVRNNLVGLFSRAVDENAYHLRKDN